MPSQTRRLLTLLAFALFAASSLPSPVMAQQESDNTLADSIEQCDTCHGQAAPIRSLAPLLDGLPRRYLERQMDYFLTGQRTGSDTNQATARMVAQLASLTPAEIHQLARHYAGRHQVEQTTSVAGDAATGASLVEAHCSGCHGSALGRLFTGSPPISQLRSDYVLVQLQAFASGRRRIEEPSRHQAKMIAVAQRFSDRQLLDISAGLKALPQ